MADADSSSNPLLSEFDFPPFDRVEPVHVRPGIRALLARLEGEQEELEKGMEPAWERLVHPLERIFDRLNVVWNVVDHLKAVKDSADLCAAIKNVQPKKVKFYLRLGQSKPIYEAFNAIRNSSDLNSLSDARKRVVEGRQGPPSPSSSGYAGDRGSSVASSAGIEEPDPAPPLTPGAEDWARGKKHADEDDGSASWWKRKKHFFILSNSGKPIYSRYGDEHRLAGFSATCKRSFLLLRTVVIILNL